MASEGLKKPLTLPIGGVRSVDPPTSDVTDPPLLGMGIFVNIHEPRVDGRPWVVSESRCGYSLVVCLGDPASTTGT